VALKAAALLCLFAGWALLPRADYDADLWITREDSSFIDNLANFDGAWFVRVAALGYRRLAEGDYDLKAETKRLRVMDRLGYNQGRWPPKPGSDRFDRGYGFRHWPLFPLLIRALSLTGLDPVLSGVIISNLFAMAYGVLLYLLVRIDLDRRTAILAVALSQLHPGGYALTAVFNESMFLALAAGAMFSARKSRWWIAGLLSMAAAATRIDGALLALPLAYEWMTQRAEREAGGVEFAAVLGVENIKRGFRAFAEWPGVWWCFLIPAGTVSVIAYFYLVSGDALIWTKVHEVNKYGHVNWPWLMLLETFRKGFHVWGKELPLHALLFIVLILSFKRVRGTYWIWMLMFFIYHSSNANHSYLRYQAQCLPLFIAMAQLAEERRGPGKFMLGTFAVTFAIFGAMFINGYWVA
jgi:hypothetical protein